MLDTMRRYVEAGMGMLSSKRAEELARALVEQGQAGREQASRLAGELKDWSRQGAERLAGLVQREVKKQVKGLGFATRSELDALKKRVKVLEDRAAKPATKRATSTSKSAAKRTTSKKRSTAKPPGGSG